jgi:hypothetical protein
VQIWVEESMKSDVARSCSEELELGSRWRDIRGLRADDAEKLLLF